MKVLDVLGSTRRKNNSIINSTAPQRRRRGRRSRRPSGHAARREALTPKCPWIRPQRAGYSVYGGGYQSQRVPFER